MMEFQTLITTICVARLCSIIPRRIPTCTSFIVKETLGFTLLKDELMVGFVPLDKQGRAFTLFDSAQDISTDSAERCRVVEQS